MDRWDPEMRAFAAMMEERGRAFPPVAMTPPLDAARAANDGPGLTLAAVGGPRMAESGDRWLSIRGRRLACRVHKPRTDGPLPVMVYIHGGGWVWGSIDTHDHIMRAYAAAAGCAVVGPDYALAPEAPFPQALEECAAVVRWVALHGAEWGLDPSRIVVGGDSAGGNLAIATALLLRETDPGLALRGLLLNYGVFDSRLDTASYAEFATGHTLTREKMDFYWRCYAPRDADRLHPLAAPLRADLAGLPPCLLHVAELDVLAAENHAMADRLRAAGVDVEATTFPGVLHGFLRAIGHVKASDRAVAEAGGWLARRFG
ncbi:alpha/beta hydrolase [Roseomonas sp. PWR1]|uniref:Alpha/beta hydrolase n=1 Tax=Roseomonas nitratireducens TaxID=2820810 RepID=A0ABS4AXC6_9PROT|nr:alpha/beta hydrolase [Neoroseomonas nitratireducens]MBP0466045.1 alpha/beta hydrolase [Neoroseomonas nitratireducens]